ncbi:MAG TPA: AmmeMemoRadiSam system protein A [Burkholderiaceae bacterium]|nr:AmmeMemoRadiSam system protein A [Burkholderiaceae bacterium]
MTGRELGHAVLTIARSAIAERLGLGRLKEASHAALQQHSATFVTLRNTGQLRGCIGSLQATRPLALDVRENAIAAAFRDPRFAPLEVAEFAATSVEVSLLSAAERVEVASEQELLARLRPGVDGLILEFGRHRATFLPQVWEALAEPREFLAALKEKAGLPEGFWHTNMSVSRYLVTKWVDLDFAW